MVCPRRDGGEHLFCPRRATKEHEELQRQHICPRRTRRAAENCNGDCNFLLSTEGHEGTRRTATATHLSTEDTEGRGELQRRLQLPFVHGGPRRNTKNCKCGNTFVHGGHGGPRRTATATATSFCPRRATKEHEELQRQHICPRRTRRAAENCNGDCNFLLSTEGREGPRRATKNCNGNFLLSTEGREGPRRATKNCNGNTFVHGGHGGPRRTATATATSFCPRRATKEHEELQRQHICPRRTRRAAENCNGDCNFLLSTKGHEENLCQIIIWSVHEGTRGTPYVVDADHGRRSRESGEKRSDCARRRSVLSHCEQSSLSVNGPWSVVRTFGPGVDQETDFGNIHVFQSRIWERPVERRRS